MSIKRRRGDQDGQSGIYASGTADYKEEFVLTQFMAIWMGKRLVENAYYYNNLFELNHDLGNNCTECADEDHAIR